MNYLKATELRSGGYHYTITNDNRTRPHTCCNAHALTPHATAEEAERCKYEYEMGRAHTATGGKTAHKCLECGEWTSHMYIVDQVPVTLCQMHQTPQMLRKHNPFAPGIASWES